MIKLDVITGNSTENKQKFIEKLYGNAKNAVVLPATALNAEYLRAVLHADNAAERIAADLDCGKGVGEFVKEVGGFCGVEKNLVLCFLENEANYSGEDFRAVTGEADAVILSGFSENDINATVEKIKERNPRVTVLAAEGIKNGKTLVENLEDGKRILNLFSADIKNLFNEKH